MVDGTQGKVNKNLAPLFKMVDSTQGIAGEQDQSTLHL
jgi:hypothetical protein